MNRLQHGAAKDRGDAAGVVEEFDIVLPLFQIW